MGRDLYFYRIDPVKIKTNLSAEIQKEEPGTLSFEKWVKDTPLSLEVLSDKIHTHPWELTGEELEVIQLWFWNRKPDRAETWDEMINVMAGCGFTLSLSIDITRYCCVIMEEFTNFFTDLPEQSSPPAYRLSSYQLAAFTDWLIILFGVFLIEDNIVNEAEATDIKKVLASYEHLPEQIQKARQIFTEEVIHRKEQVEDYHRKWSNDYFSTAWLFYNFLKLKAEITYSEVFFYLNDSY